MDKKDLDIDWEKTMKELRENYFGMKGNFYREGNFHSDPGQYFYTNQHAPTNNLTVIKDRKQAQWDRMEFAMIPCIEYNGPGAADDFMLQAFFKANFIAEIRVTSKEMMLYDHSNYILRNSIANFMDKKNILDFIKWRYYFRQYITPVE